MSASPSDEAPTPPPSRPGTGVFMPRTSMDAGPRRPRRYSINIPGDMPPHPCASGHQGLGGGGGARQHAPPARCSTASSISCASARPRRRSCSSIRACPARATSCLLLGTHAQHPRASAESGGGSCSGSAFPAALPMQLSGSGSIADAHAHVLFAAPSPRMSLEFDARCSCSIAWPQAHGALVAERMDQTQLQVLPGSCMPAAAAAAATHQAASGNGWCALPDEGGSVVSGYGAAILGAGSLGLASPPLAPALWASASPEPLTSPYTDSIEPLLLAPNTEEALLAIDDRLAELLALQHVLLARRDASDTTVPAMAGLVPACSLQAGGVLPPGAVAAPALVHCTAPPAPALRRPELDVAAADTVLRQLAVMQQAEALLQQELLQIVCSST